MHLGRAPPRTRPECKPNRKNAAQQPHNSRNLLHSPTRSKTSKAHKSRVHFSRHRNKPVWVGHSCPTHLILILILTLTLTLRCPITDARSTVEERTLQRRVRLSNQGTRLQPPKHTTIAALLALSS
jgi:hypothetical protein